MHCNIKSSINLKLYVHCTAPLYYKQSRMNGVPINVRWKKSWILISLLYRLLFNINCCENWGRNIQTAEYNGAYTVSIFILIHIFSLYFHPNNFIIERNTPWFESLQLQLIALATRLGQCLGYLGYISLAGARKKWGAPKTCIWWRD